MITTLQKVQRLLISLTEKHFILACQHLLFFNHLAPPPSFLSERLQFHPGTHLSRGKGIHKSHGAEGMEVLEGEDSS